MRSGPQLHDVAMTIVMFTFLFLFFLGEVKGMSITIVEFFFTFQKYWVLLKTSKFTIGFLILSIVIWFDMDLNALIL